MIDVRALVEKAKTLGTSAVAVTDHAVLAGAVELQHEAERVGIRPIFGCEVYVARCSRYDKTDDIFGPHNFVLLAENEEGWRNLVRLVSAPLVEGYFDTPKVDKEMLRRYSSGLIALSGGADGEVASALAEEGEECAAAVVWEYQEIFPDGRFFIEVQANGGEEQAALNNRLIRLSRNAGAPLVATCDVHYLDAGDARSHAILRGMPRPDWLSFPGRLAFTGGGFHMKTPWEMWQAFGKIAPDAIENTVKIAHRCNVSPFSGQPRVPGLPTQGGVSQEDLLRKQAREGLEVRLGRIERVYRERLDQELDLIERKGFAGYFLVVADYVNFARQNRIAVGPGRGSAPGSLVAWALGITDIDPIRHGLLFERFINEDTETPPDISVDFCAERRGEILRYIEGKYGQSHVARPIVIGRLRARNAVRAAGTQMGMLESEIESLLDLIPPGSRTTVKQAMEDVPILAERAASDSKIAEVLHHAGCIEWSVNSIIPHPSGLIISDETIDEWVPRYSDPKWGISTQCDWSDTEQIGLIKFDLLGHRALTVTDRAVRLIRESGSAGFDLAGIPLDDTPTISMLSAGDTGGIEGCDDPGFTEFLRRLVPGSFSDLLAAMALWRPGPIEKGLLDEFVEARHGRKSLPSDFLEVDHALEETHGVLVYGEQIMEIAVEVADFAPWEADRFRKALVRKESRLIGRPKDAFLRGGMKNGHLPDRLEVLFDRLHAEAAYQFPKAHAIAYGLISYRMAYLKCHYRKEFEAARIDDR